MLCHVVNLDKKPIEATVELHDIVTGGSLNDPASNSCDDGPVAPNGMCIVQALIGEWKAGFCTADVNSKKVRAALTVVVPGGSTVAVLPLTK